MKRFISFLITTTLLSLVFGMAIATELVPMKPNQEKEPSDFATDAALGALDCSGAVEVVLGTTYTGTNVGAPNNVSTYGCSSWNETGGEVVYHVVFPVGVVWQVSLVANGCDLDLALLTQCDENLGCLGVFDNGVLVPFPYPGEFYFVVDGFNGAACGYEISFETSPYEPPTGEVGDFCSRVIEGTGSQFTGNTCDGADLVSEVGDCGALIENGLDHYYEIFMPAGSEFYAEVISSVDGALWLLDGCAGMVSCLGFSDATGSGQSELIGWYNGTGEETSVFLVIDSYGVGSCGDYVLDLTSWGGAVATEVMSFGELKALFR